MKPMKKQSFLQGAGILALATIAVKIIGALYKIPLTNIIGTEGNTYFLQSYDIYAFLLTLSTAGLPVAMSRMIAAAQTQGNLAQVRRINQAAMRVFLLLGVGGSLVMMLLCKPLAAMMGIPDGSLAILVLGPAVLFVCLNSSFRGFFQGQSIMTPTGLSQVIEAACKLVLGLLLAYIIKKTSDNVIHSVAGAILGVTIGSVLAFIYLYVEYRRYAPALNDRGRTRPTQSLKATIRELLTIAIPITIGSAGLQVISLIDNALVMRRLASAGFDYDAAKVLRGLYGSAQTLFNLPGALVLPFTISIIPAITACLTRRDTRGALRTENSAVRIMTLLILPCGVGLGVLGQPIIQLLYSATFSDAEIQTAGALLSILSVAVILNGLVLLLNAIMQAHGFVSLPVANMIIGGVVKVLVNFILVGMPKINIYGAPIGTVSCFLVITILDIFCINRVVRHPPKVVRLMIKPFIACLMMGCAAYLGNSLLCSVVSPKLACLGAIVLAVIVYAVMVLALQIITYADCLLLPQGKKIAKFLRIR